MGRPPGLDRCAQRAHPGHCRLSRPLSWANLKHTKLEAIFSQDPKSSRLPSVILDTGVTGPRGKENHGGGTGTGRGGTAGWRQKSRRELGRWAAWLPLVPRNADARVKRRDRCGESELWGARRNDNLGEPVRWEEHYLVCVSPTPSLASPTRPHSLSPGGPKPFCTLNPSSTSSCPPASYKRRQAGT